MKIAVFTKNRTNPAYEAARLGADRAAKWLGAQTVHFVPDTGDDPDEQTALIAKALTMSFDAFVFTPVHATKVNSAIERIFATRIPVFGFVNPIPVGHCVTYVGSDDHELGLQIASYLYRSISGRGKVLLVSGPEASVTSIARIQAFRDAALDFPDIQIVDTCIGDYVRKTAYDVVARWLAGNKNPDGYAVANDIMAVGVIDALHEVGLKAEVVGVNAIPEAIAAIKNGDMLATADFNAMDMAFLATECAIRYLRGEHVPERIDLPVQIVDRNNYRLWDLPYEKRPVRVLEEIIKS